MAGIEGRTEQILSYFKLFHGDKVPMSKIQEESPQVIDAVNEMIARGRLVGQGMFTQSPNPGLIIDIILWMPEKNYEPGT